MKLYIRYLVLFALCFLFKETVACNKYYGSDYGTQKVPGRSCSDIAKQRCGKNEDGTYWIRLGSSTPFPVFCNMEAGGWTLVFKLVAGISGRPAGVWNTPFSTYEYSLAALNVNNNFKHHYKNRIVQNWNTFKPREARVVLYKDSNEEAVLRFNAANSDNKNWFSAAKVLESPWLDLLSASKNYFTIDGPGWHNLYRDFHINHKYGGCPNDDGWLSVGDSATCKWETRHASGVKLLYSKEATRVNYNSYSKVGVADVFAVFLR